MNTLESFKYVRFKILFVLCLTYITHGYKFQGGLCRCEKIIRERRK